MFLYLLLSLRRGTAIGQNLKSVKLLRVLRPLKMVNRVPALKVSERLRNNLSVQPQSINGFLFP